MKFGFASETLMHTQTLTQANVSEMEGLSYRVKHHPQPNPADIVLQIQRVQAR